MSLLKSLRTELGVKNIKEASLILNKMISEGYPKVLVDSISQEIENFRNELLTDSVNSTGVACHVLIISSPGDKMTNYYRAEFLNEIIFKNSEYSSNLVKSSEVSKEMINSADLIFISRGGVSKDLLIDLERAKERGVCIVFDIDDYIFDENVILSIRHIAQNPKKLSDMQKHARRLSLIASMSDVIITSTYYLAKRARQKFGKPCFVIPNVIKNSISKDASELINKRKTRKTKHIRLGYFSGTKSHEEDFKQIENVIYGLMKDREDIEFLVCGELITDKFKEFGSRFIKIPLQNYKKMHEYLSTVHVNLAPLELVNIFVHGKSELKIFDAAIYEIPTLASRSDSYSSVIFHGTNGLLCDIEQDWRESIEYLLNNPNEIYRLGLNAKNTISSRYQENNVEIEYRQLLTCLNNKSYRRYSEELNISNHQADRVSDFSISLITILYKKEKELPYFLESVRRQDFDYPFELIVVNDCSPDDSLKILDKFNKIFKNLPGSNNNLSIKIINLTENVGNCDARNIGINAAQSDIVSVVDADCVLNSSFLKSHYDAHMSHECDVAIGPKGIETHQKHPFHILSLVDMSEEYSLDQASPQDVHNQASFINTVTRNLSFRKGRTRELIGENFFDKDFSYSKDPNSGFGWEDVEFGVRLHKSGAKFIFLNKTASIHISHDATENVGDKAFRSLKNFHRLNLKHPDVKNISKIWFTKTLDAIEKWCEKTDAHRYQSDALKIINELKENNHSFLDSRKIFNNFNRLKKLKIITTRWHCPHQYELYKLGCEFHLLEGFNHSFFNEWEYRKRPLPYNAKFVNLKEFNPKNYDLALIHFDENVLRPDLCNDKVPLQWGDAFRYLSELSLPKIYLCHGTPQFYGQYNSDCDMSAYGLEINETKEELVRYVGNEHVVCNSLQAKIEWGFSNSSVIYHGFSASEFSYFNPDVDGRFVGGALNVLSLPKNALAARPLYNGMELFQEIFSSVNGDKIKIQNIAVPDPSAVCQSDISIWSQVKFKLYLSELKKYHCYLNTTKRSPMPRTRAEAMFSGAIVITTPDHDINNFIKHGENGFIINSSNDAVESLNLILDNPGLRKRVAISSYESAIINFSQESYLSAWVNILLNNCN